MQVTKQELDKVLIELNKILVSLDNRLQVLEKTRTTRNTKSQAKDLTKE
jgi:hypothetical protein